MHSDPSPVLALESLLSRFADAAAGRCADEVSGNAMSDVGQADHEYERRAKVGAINAPGVLIRSEQEAAEARSSQPVMVDLGPILRFLTMLRCLPRGSRTHGRVPTLPAGCVIVVRYTSR